MPTIIPTGFGAVIQAVQAQLTAITGLPPERVNTTTTDGPTPHFQGDQDILVRVGTLTPVGEDIDSKGRLMTRAIRLLHVTPRTSLAIDVRGTTAGWLTDPTYGHLQLEERIFDALHQFAPQDVNGNWLVTEQMRLVPCEAPKRPDPTDLAPLIWGESTLTFELSYILNLPSNVG